MVWAARLTPAIVPPVVAALLLATSGTPVGAAPAPAAGIVRGFELGWSGEVFGDFVEIGNGNVRCPDADAPADPGGTPAETCLQAQRGRDTAATAVNDSYYMQHADVDGSPATFNSSRARLTVPAGAAVAFARLSWAGDTGRITLADGRQAPDPGCNDRQFLPGAGTAVPPPGTPDTTPARLTVGSAAPVAVPPAVFTSDPMDVYGPGNPQYYSAFADVTAAFAGVPTGEAVPVTVGDIWTPEGFGCFAGWSLTLVYAFDRPDPGLAPVRRSVHVYGGHVRQASDTPPTTTEVTGLRVARGRARVGVTAFEGDHNIGRDGLTVNGTPLPESRSGRTANFFVSAADGALEPDVPINMSVDAKSQTTELVPAGATGATLTFDTAGDSYLATGLAFSAPIPAVVISHETVGSAVRPGEPMVFRITVAALGAGVTDARVSDALFPECRKDIGALGPGESQTYTCNTTAPRADTTSVAAVTAVDAFGYPLTATDEAPVAVVDSPAIDLTKLTVNVNGQPAAYAPGETVTFTLITTNTGDAPLHDVVLDDPVVPACSATYPALEPGESVEKRCTAIAPIAGEVNTATVTAADDAGTAVTDTATAPVPSAGGTISGAVLADRNGNGVLDAGDGDSPVAGAPVALAGRTDHGTPVEATTTTGPDGRYTFPVPAGVYRITAPQPPGFQDGPDVPGPGAAPDGNDALLVTLASGATSDGNTFAEYGGSGLAGMLFDDIDGNGSPGPGEPGTEGVPVTLTGTDEAGNPLRLTTPSTADGSYAFPRLRPGVYELSRPQPAGLLSGVATPGTAGGTPTGPDTISGIALGPDTAASGYTFAGTRPAALSGAVVDDGGAGVAGVPVTMSGRTPAGAPVERTTSSGPDGSWTVPDLPTGTYTVLVPQPPGYGDGPNTPGTAGGASSGPNTISRIPLAAGQQAGGYTFGLTRAAITGNVFVDVDGDGVRGAGEPGLGGVPVTVSGTDAAGAPVERSATTGPDGGYRVGELVGGRYAITQTQPVGYGDGPDSPGSAGGTATGGDTIEGVEPAGGVVASGYDFAEHGARVSGAVVDENGSGLAGMSVALAGTDISGTAVQRTTTTGPDGSFALAGLPAGDYVISTTRPDGYGDGPDTAGSAGGAPSGPDTIAGIRLGPGEEATGYRFTHDLASAGGQVYRDRDRDGARDDGEPGVGGLEVVLTGSTVTGKQVRRSTTTGDDGRYRVDGLLAGNYAVTGVETGEYAADERSGIALPAGADATGLDVALRAGALGGRVVDENGEGLRGATVTVSGTSVNGREAGDTGTTGADGAWTVRDLPAGTYSVVVRRPAGYGDGPDTPGSAGGSATAPGRISGIDLAPGQEADGYTFTATLGSLSGRVFVDVDEDGVRDDGEPGLGGVTVSLTGADATGAAVERGAVTDPDGDYRIDGLRSGRYTLVETQPSGYDGGVAEPGTAGGTAVAPDVVQGIALSAGDDARGYDFHEHVHSGQPPPTGTP